jgi:phosphonate transport system substrate-binding protein
MLKRMVLTLIVALLFATGANAETYKLGIVPQFKSAELMKRWQPIIDELKKEGVNVKFVGSASIPDFEMRLKKGEFDIAYMNPYHALVANKRQGYQPIIRDHGRALKGILVVPNTSEVKDVKALSGKSFAFPAPNALGASLLMRAELAQKQGVIVAPKYVKTHKAVYRNVAFGGAAAGGGVMRTFNQQPDEVKSRLKIVYETSSVAPHPVSVHPRVPSNVANKIQEVFLRLGQTNEGKKWLSKIPMKNVGKATLSDYDALDALGLDQFAK